jgi:hypothetical protein
MNTSFCIGSTGTCDHCNKNGRILNGNWLIRTGSDVCIKCTNDDKIRKLYYNDFIPEYDDNVCYVYNDDNNDDNDNDDNTEDNDSNEAATKTATKTATKMKQRLISNEPNHW